MTKQIALRQRRHEIEKCYYLVLKSSEAGIKALKQAKNAMVYKACIRCS
jgi:hypothetical protein